MKLSSQFEACLLLSAACSALGQTPPGTQPVASQQLSVRYGSQSLIPDTLLPESTVATAPIVSLNSSLSGTHMVALIDLSIPQSDINSTGPEARGLEYCRTTRVHWLQTGLVQSSNGSFTSSVDPIAQYGGPMPGLNDIAHTYTFYLFKQPSNFTLPPWDAGRNYNPISVYARMNFSIEAIAQVAGPPIAANYMRVVDPNSTEYGTFPNGTCPFSLNGTNGTYTSAPVATATGAASKLAHAANFLLWTLGAAMLANL